MHDLVTFAMPHRSLGEEVAALVVLHEGVVAGATAQLQRIEFAEKRGVA